MLIPLVSTVYIISIWQWLTVSAAVRFIPSPPALVLSRNTNMSDLRKNKYAVIKAVCIQRIYMYMYIVITSMCAFQLGQPWDQTWLVTCHVFRGCKVHKQGLWDCFFIKVSSLQGALIWRCPHFKASSFQGLGWLELVHGALSPECCTYKHYTAVAYLLWKSSTMSLRSDMRDDPSSLMNLCLR